MPHEWSSQTNIKGKKSDTWVHTKELIHLQKVQKQVQPIQDGIGNCDRESPQGGHFWDAGSFLFLDLVLVVTQMCSLCEKSSTCIPMICILTYFN